MLDEVPLLCLTPDLKQSIERCQKLQYLSLDSCALESLGNMPELPRLEVIELNSNKLKDADIEVLCRFTKLRRIFLRDNQIARLESLAPLAKLQDLVQIELKWNPVTDLINYRETLYSTYSLKACRIRSLEIVDGRDRQGNEMEDLSEYSSDSAAESESEGSSISQSQQQQSSNRNNQQQDQLQDVARKQRKLN